MAPDRSSHRSPHPPSRRGRGFGITAEFTLLLALAAVPWIALAAPLFAPVVASDVDRAAAPTMQFAPCRGTNRAARRVTCIVDGDTLWIEGEKIRIADIDTPEVTRPACPREAALGRRATRRMMALANAGPFTVTHPDGGRDTDRYGRALRVLTRDGRKPGRGAGPRKPRREMGRPAHELVPRRLIYSRDGARPDRRIWHRITDTS